MSTAVEGAITDEGLEQLTARIGRERAIEEPFIEFVNSDSLRHVARALGDKNRLWTDQEYAGRSRYGARMAPPALLYGVGWGSWDLRRGEGLPGVHALHAGDHWYYHRPLLEGDRVNATATLRSVEPRPSRYAGKSVLQTREIQFKNERSEPVARCFMSIIRTERGGSRERGKYAAIQLARYSQADLQELDDEMSHETVRGAETRYWEDVKIGQPIPGILRGPLSLGDMLVWQVGLGGVSHVATGPHWLDFRRRHPKTAIRDPETGVPQSVELVHYDKQIAAAVGMPAPYDIGAQRATWATVAMTNWVGDDGFLVELDVSFRAMNFLGDVTRIRGRVTAKWQGSSSGTGFVDCELEAMNQRGEVSMPIKAVVALPSQVKGALQFPIDVRDERGGAG